MEITLKSQDFKHNILHSQGLVEKYASPDEVDESSCFLGIHGDNVSEFIPESDGMKCYKAILLHQALKDLNLYH